MHSKGCNLGSKNTAAEFQNFSGKVLKTVGIGIAATIAGIGAAIAGMAKQVLTGFEGLARIQRITAQTEAVIKSTGSAAGLTADEIVKMSDNLETLTATESESNQEAANMLLTFTSIGKDVFPDALTTVADMARAFDKTGNATIDMTSQAVMLGKALNVTAGDTTAASTAMNAMKRVGVAFTEDQIKNGPGACQDRRRSGLSKINYRRTAAGVRGIC